MFYSLKLNDESGGGGEYDIDSSECSTSAKLRERE